MTRNRTTSDRATTAAPTPRRFLLYVWLGPLVAFAGAVSYFLVFVRFPSLRDVPWLNLPWVVAGLLISAVGLWRASTPDRTAGAKMVATAGLLVSLSLTLLFSTYVFYLSYQLPQTGQIAQVSQMAPDFVLLDQNRQNVRLSDQRGTKVVLVFYRGHW
jgi:hypothetical protein